MIPRAAPAPSDKARLYDLMWLYPLSGDAKPAAVQQGQPNTIAPADLGIPGAILYPALLTPAIVVGHDWGELLIAFDGKSLKGLKSKSSDLEKAIKLAINRQLKVWRGSLNTEKRYTDKPIFGNEDWADHIKIKGPIKLDTSPMKTLGIDANKGDRPDSAFMGRLQPTFVSLLKKNKTVFDQIYQVSLNSGPLLDIPEHSGDKARNTVGPDGTLHVTPENPGNFDHVIHTAPGIQSPKLPGKGKYAFTPQQDDVIAGEVNWKNPLQAYHPLFAYQQLDYATIGFMADVHVNSRQQVLKRTPARVIEHDDFKGHPIGSMVSLASQCTRNLFHQFGDSDVKVVVIGGDLVDFMHNIVLEDRTSRMKVTQIWDAVDMDKRTDYHDYVDYLAFYALVTEFINMFQKPILVFTGNHDCYYEPYGISPRMGPARANEGIPWDHNLTIYEAILAFGPTYGKILTAWNARPLSGRPASSFWDEKLAWFYTAFTPFSDFMVRLPKQYLVVLGWGTSEDMISLSRPSGQGIGHLPRANTCITSDQLAILRAPMDKKLPARKHVLFTHFNFVSYRGEFTNAEALDKDWGSSGEAGKVYYDSFWKKFSRFDMGTFHDRREEVYENILYKEQAYELILTGHSHRRAFYTFRSSNGTYIQTGFFDYPIFDNGKPVEVTDNTGKAHRIGPDDQRPPYVIVTDSGGSIPRVNFGGEFFGWGSDVPAGTVVTFGASGDILRIDAKRVGVARAKPRFVVALDFMDILGSHVIESFATEKFPVDDEDNPDWRYVFHLVFGQAIREHIELYYLQGSSVHLYYPDGPTWNSIELEGQGKEAWAIPQRQNREFRYGALGNAAEKRKSFLSIWFTGQARTVGQYDFKTPWTFEIDIKEWTGALKSGGAGKSYELLRRTKEWGEIPDLKARKTYPGY